MAPSIPAKLLLLLTSGASLVLVGLAGCGRFSGEPAAKRESPSPKVTVVVTVGAGDKFQAALLARLLRGPDGPKAAIAALDRVELDAMLSYAARAAALTCSRRGADLPRAAELSD